MRFKAKLSISNQRITPNLGIIHRVSDGGYERGYAEGYEKGNEDGLHKGYADGREFGYNVGYGIGKQDGYNEGLAARNYEVWTFTLVDGTVVEKEVALL